MAGNAFYAKGRSTGITYEDIVKDVRDGLIKPVYYLMGEESYYIDRIADFIVSRTVRPEERDFNLMTFYGPETDMGTVLTAAKAYPMGARWLVVLVKEAQGLKGKERLEAYLQKVQPTTVLIFCHKNGSLDRRLKVAAQIAKVGVLYESKKMGDRQLPVFVQNYLKRKNVVAGPGVPEMMGEYVGADLNRMAGELDKLILALPNGSRTVTEEMVRATIARSKNFNIFELQDAIGEKNVEKVNRIVKYFDSNSKDYPLQFVLPSLFKYFSNVLLAFYSPERSERGIAGWLGMADWQVRKNVLPPMRAYSGMKVLHILEEIRRTDARSKGVDTPATSGSELMKELIFYILH